MAFQAGNGFKGENANHIYDERSAVLRDNHDENAIAHPEEARPDRDHSVDRHHVLSPRQFHDGELEPDPHEGHLG